MRKRRMKMMISKWTDSADLLSLLCSAVICSVWSNNSKSLPVQLCSLHDDYVTHFSEEIYLVTRGDHAAVTSDKIADQTDPTRTQSPPPTPRSISKPPYPHHQLTQLCAIHPRTHPALTPTAIGIWMTTSYSPGHRAAIDALDRRVSSWLWALIHALDELAGDPQWQQQQQQQQWQRLRIFSISISFPFAFQLWLRVVWECMRCVTDR